MRLAPLLLLTMVCSGCSAVVSTEPLGQRIPINAKDWEGVWTAYAPKDEDGRWNVQVIDADSGELRISDDEDECTAFVGASGGWTIVSIGHCSKDPASADYLWGVVAFDDDVMTVWVPDPHKVGDLVDAGRLPGERDGDDVRLYPLTDADYELMTSEQYGVLLNWKHPLLVRRVNSAVTP
jgi:hypothetical protein